MLLHLFKKSIKLTTMSSMPSLTVRMERADGKWNGSLWQSAGGVSWGRGGSGITWHAAFTSRSLRSVRLKMVSPVILPKMVCLRSSCCVGSKVIKNWLLLLSGKTASPLVSPAQASKPLRNTLDDQVTQGIQDATEKD